MRQTLIAVALIATPMLWASNVLAGPVAPGFNTNVIPAADDAATGAINLGFLANFYGSTYAQAFVSNNGYLTFNTGQTSFSTSGLGTGYTGQPIIAAFFADVDTRGAGSGLVSYGTGTYNGRAAFGATWPGVGHYNQAANKLDTFQIILTNRSDTGAGNFDIYFNYDQIQWETGAFDGGTDGLGGTSATVGYNAGLPGNPSGTYFEFPGSRVPGSFIDGGPLSLSAGSNDGVVGQYLFMVRNGTITDPTTDPTTEPTTGVPEPMSMALLGTGLVSLGLIRRR